MTERLITMSYIPSAFENRSDLLDRVRSVKGVTGATPFIYTEVMQYSSYTGPYF